MSTDHTFDAMMIAMRVLRALNEKRPPEPGDVDRLREFAPLAANLPPDELACDVIQQVVRYRLEARGSGAGGDSS